MSHMVRIGSVVVGNLALLIALSLSASAAGMHVQTLRLHGVRPAARAMASAVITQVSAGDYRVVVTASGLPAPTTLHAMPLRHNYVAWVQDQAMHGAMMGMVPLTYNATKHQYTGMRVVMMMHVSRVFVTADPKATPMAMPAMPELIVLDSQMAMHKMTM